MNRLRVERLGLCRKQQLVEELLTMLIQVFGGRCSDSAGLGSQGDRNSGIHLFPLELVEALSRNGQTQCFSSLKVLHILTFNPHIDPVRWVLLPPPPPPTLHLGLPRWLTGKEFACQAGYAGDVGSIPGSGRCSGGGNGNPLQYSYLEKSHGQRSLAGYRP